MIESMTRALMRLSDRDSHKAALVAGGLLVAAPAATWSVLAVVHSSMAWRQTLLRGTSWVGVAIPRANPQTTPAGRDRQIAHLGRPARRGVARCRRTPWRSPGPAPTGSPRPLARTAAGRPSPMPGARPGPAPPGPPPVGRRRWSSRSCRWPGLLAEWAQRGGGWFGRVVYAVDDGGRVVLVEACHLEPAVR